MSETPVKIFIGSGEQSLLERKVLIYSLHKHSQRQLDISVFNGTHNAVETDGQAPAPAPLPLHLKYRNQTEFSLYRYLIPELCSYQGRAIYLDSDMICLTDIGTLFDSVMGECDFVAKREYAERNGLDYTWARTPLFEKRRRTMPPGQFACSLVCDIGSESRWRLRRRNILPLSKLPQM
jgi:hypothetical protein